MSEYKTGEQMAADNERLQEYIRVAQEDMRGATISAFTLGVEAGLRLAAERIAAGGTVQEKGGGEAVACRTCGGGGSLLTMEADRVTCLTCGGTGKAKE